MIGALEDELAEKAHEVVSDDGEAEGSLGSPEVLEMEALNTEVVLEFLDAVLGVAAITVEAPDGRGRKLKAREVGAVAVTGIEGLILPDLELAACGKRESPRVLAYEDEEPIRKFVCGS